MEIQRIILPKEVPEGPYPHRDQFDKFSEEQLEIDIEELDKKFWLVAENLDNVLLQHINNRGITIV